MSPSPRTVVVVGGGPGGYAAACRAAALGARVQLIERAELGGTCVNRGCIPAKAWLRTAEILHLCRTSAAFGVLAEPTIDFARARTRVEQVVAAARDAAATRLAELGIEVIHGAAAVTAGPQVLVSVEGVTRRFSADGFVLAVGSSPAFPAVAGIDCELVVPAEEALFFSEPPERLAILGGGAVGVELATIYSILGTKVIIVEAERRLVSGFDADLSEAAVRGLRGIGVEVLLRKTTRRIVQDGGVLRLDLGQEQVIVDRLAVCVGRRPNTADLGLEELGLRTNGQGFIVVDRCGRTSCPSVYAVGDAATGGPMLAHAASAQGSTAGALAAGLDVPASERFVPACVSGAPELGMVGLTEAQAREQGFEVAVGVGPLTGNALAACYGLTEGFVKVVTERGSGGILGVHVAGPRACELIAEAATAMTFGSTASELEAVIRPHPSFSEAMYAALAAIPGRVQE